MSPETIELHFKEAMDSAFRLREEADKLNCLVEENMTGLLCDIRADWSGRCAETVLEKEVKIAARLKEETYRLSKISSELEERAREMCRSEMVNYRLAASRIY